MAATINAWMALFHDIIRLTPFYITLFWGLAFLFNPVEENRARYGLGIFMLTASVIYFSHAVFFMHEYGFYLKIDGLYILADLLVYPMYYLYIRLLTKDVDFKKSYFFHFIPAIILAGAFTIVHLMASTALREAYLNEVLLHHHWPETGTILLKMMAALYFFSRIVFGIQALTYLILSLRLIKKHQQRIVNFYSNLQGKKLVWLQLLTYSLILTAISSFYANLMGRQFFENHHLLVYPSLVFSSLLFIMGILGNKQNQIIAEIQENEISDVDPYEKPENQNLLKGKLVAFMEKEKPFLNPNLRITDLSSQLFTNRTYLSHLINTEFKMSFSDFVNRYRIQHAKCLIDKDMGSNYSLNYFSENSGFGSVSSFLRAFKQVEGVTAGTYRQQAKIAS
jgi:AraC-like DNA-binding protein